MQSPPTPETSTGEGAPASPAPTATSSAGTNKLVVKNTIYLTLSQALTVPISLVINAVGGRYLGSEAFGIAYFTTTLCTLGFLAVNWGHEGVLPAVVARSHAAAPLMLGSSIVWRLLSSVVVYAVMAFGCHYFGYNEDVQWALALTAVYALLTSLVAACKDTIRGLERAEIPAIAHVAQQLLGAFIVVPILLLGGKLNATLFGHVAACAAVLVAIVFALRPAGVRGVQVSWDAIKKLFSGGTPFVILNLAMALQPNIDAIFLSKLAPTEVMGWYAVTRRLVGVILFPAAALIGALYPTLCRLHGTDESGFLRTVSGALRSVALLVIPLAVGCALFPEIAISMFSREKFGPAEDNLRILAPFVFLVYFSMPLGTAILASGKQRAWSIVQSLCVVVSLALDPLLVPWFQARTGNGGMGLCVATFVSELVVVVCGLLLAPRGIFDRKFARTMAFGALSGAAMALVGRLAAPLTVWLAAPLALLTYIGVLLATGGIEREQLAALRGFIGRRFSR